MKIALSVKHQGPVPAFKNSKALVVINGKPRMFTKKEYKQWMKRCIRSFESQLFCVTQIGGGGTPTVPLLHSSIASSLPHDDSWDWIPQLSVYAELCPKGEEGAAIIIEQL